MKSRAEMLASTPGKALRQALFRAQMETVGIEPTSAGALRTASTSVAGALNLAPRLPLRQGSEEPAS
jgi:hypothetical protein